MFEVPDAKRVRRHEVYGLEGREEDAASHGREDPAIREKLNERLAQMFSLDVSPNVRQSGDSDEELLDAPEEDQDEPAFEFRLFSTGNPAQKVVVTEQDAGDGRILSTRPRSHHWKDGFTPEELEQFRASALDYEDIVRGALQRAWGLEVPWRVTKITLTTGQGKTSALRKGSKGKTVDKEPGKKKRPGKKRRIALRTKEKERKQKEEERKAKEEEAAKNRLTKEEHLREKKKRLNREKKLKRRQKEKEKKLAGSAGGQAGGQSASGSDDGDL